jgi:hypothetical protein
MIARVNPKSAPTDTDVDLEVAQRFLKLLGDGPYTFQTFDDTVERKDRRLARIFHGDLDEHAETLCELNQRGAGVFVALNKTDGKGRQRENIVEVRANSLDLDGAALNPVKACALKPHIIVESSPGKYHCYWLVSDEYLDEFEDIQRGIAKRFDGDPAVALLTHVARLPGFLHNKETPFRTGLVSWGAHAPFSSDEILAEFPAQTKPHRAPSSRLVLPVGAPVVCGEEYVKRCRSAGDVPLLIPILYQSELTI